MLQWIGDSFKFLYWLGLLQLARLAVVLFCIGEVVGVLTLWAFAFSEWLVHNRPIFFCIPIGASVIVIIQVALWQFTWLQLAQRGGKWRALAEWFSSVVRYPVVRPPHAWE
jgi:hypothetical protein